MIIYIIINETERYIEIDNDEMKYKSTSICISEILSLAHQFKFTIKFVEENRSNFVNTLNNFALSGDSNKLSIWNENIEVTEININFRYKIIKQILSDNSENLPDSFWEKVKIIEQIKDSILHLIAIHKIVGEPRRNILIKGFDDFIFPKMIYFAPVLESLIFELNFEKFSSYQSLSNIDAERSSALQNIILSLITLFFFITIFLIHRMILHFGRILRIRIQVLL